MTKTEERELKRKLGNEQIDKLSVALFTQLDENSDNSIDLSEFNGWDTKIESLNSATANLFKNITGQQIFVATDIDSDPKLTINEVKALYYFDFISFDFISKDKDQDKILVKNEILSQAPIILRLVSKNCKNLLHNVQWNVNGRFLRKIRVLEYARNHYQFRINFYY